ncbi:MAG: ATP-binding cassette domain-containing protein [Bdellovibrionales bacterium]|nr:ATP-binding cassette domain-containing protein [Bdellovibrionales bacterium]
MIQSLELKSVDMLAENGHPIFQKVDWKIEKGSHHLVYGPSGSGRSVLLKMLSGLLEPSGGDLLINGQSVHQMTFEEFLPFRANIGYGFANFGLLMNRTLRENLMLPLLYHREWTLQDCDTVVNTMVEEFQIHRYVDSRPSDVPVSLQKLTLVLRAFVRSPEVLILDDPLGGLGQEMAERMAKFILRRSEANDSAVVIASQPSDFFTKEKFQIWNIDSLSLKSPMRKAA